MIDSCEKISEKFEGKNNTPLRTINLGVLFIQFATSIEEFYAYLLNRENGIIFNQDMGNIDCLVFFSLTARPQIDMQDIYEHGHTFSILLNNEAYVAEYLKMLRLDNYIAIKSGDNVKIREDIDEFTKEEYGIFAKLLEMVWYFLFQ